MFQFYPYFRISHRIAEKNIDSESCLSGEVQRHLHFSIGCTSIVDPNRGQGPLCQKKIAKKFFFFFKQNMNFKIF